MATRFLRKLTARVSTKWRKTEDNLVDSIQYILGHLGCWPLHRKQDYGILHYRYWLPRYILVMAMVITVFGPISAYQFRETDAIQIIEPLTGMFITGTLVVNIGCFLYREKTFKEVMITFKEMKTFNYEKEMLTPDVINKLKWLSRQALRYFTLTILVTFPSLMIGYPAYAIQKRDLAFRYWFPYDLKATPNFEITLPILCSDIAFGALVFFLGVTLMFTLLSETIGQLILLNHNLRYCVKKNYARQDSINAKENRKEFAVSTNHRVNDQKFQNPGSSKSKSWTLKRRSRDTLDDKATENKLRTCVRHHHAIIKFKHAFDEAFHPILLLSYICSVVPCILGSVAASHAAEFDGKLFLILSLLIIQLINQCLFCWLGEKIDEQNSLIREAVFGCDWLRESGGFKRSMRIMMTRSNRPFVIRLAGFIPMNLQSFFQILQLIYSYYMSLTATLQIKTNGNE